MKIIYGIKNFLHGRKHFSLDKGEKRKKIEQVKNILIQEAEGQYRKGIRKKKYETLTIFSLQQTNTSAMFVEKHNTCTKQFIDNLTKYHHTT